MSVVFILIGIFFPLTVFSACPSNPVEGEQGFYWDCQQTLTPTQTIDPGSNQRPIKEKSPKEENQENKCHNEKTWSVRCGFVDPKGNYDFFKKQEIVLRRSMVMHAEDSNKTLAYQKIHHWVVAQAIKVAENWEYNRLNKLPFDKDSMSFSAFGLRILKHVKKLSKKDFFKALKNESVKLIWFTREDCIYCHHMGNPMRYLEKIVNIPIINISIKGDCIKKKKTYYFECNKDEKGAMLASLARVDITPSVYAYIPKSSKKSKGGFQFIVISRGVESADMINHRLYRFTKKIFHETSKAVVEFAESSKYNKKLQ